MGRILIVADKGDTCVATSRGLELAAKLGHSVEVVAFTYEDLTRLKLNKKEEAGLKSRLLERRRELVQARIDKFAEPEQKVSLKVVWLKQVHSWIVNRAESAVFDAVVKTNHGSSGVVYTSTDWHLLRECRAPILITAENKWHRTRPVLAAVDLGTKSKPKQRLNSKILGAAKRLAEVLGVELHIISVIEIPTLLADLDLVDPISYTKDQKLAMSPHLKALAKEHDIPESDFKIKRGPVAKVITSRAAKTRAQIVVMGTIARRGLKAKFLGNTAEGVLQHMRTDVLALKPEA